ncbi:hypothetical protein MZM54_00590 [[Brevibacterium] frigoritolerans]|nr:hypothetical protein [Peribacillus frigoritolerans]
MGFVENIVSRGRKLNDPILNRDLDVTMSKYDAFRFKETVTRLESDFRDAVYRRVENAFMLEKECEERLYP